MSLESYGRPRVTMKSPFKRGARGGTPEVRAALTSSYNSKGDGSSESEGKEMRSNSMGRSEGRSEGVSYSERGSNNSTMGTGYGSEMSHNDSARREGVSNGMLKSKSMNDSGEKNMVGQGSPKEDKQTDDEINREAQGNMNGGDEYDMHVNDIMGHLESQHPEVTKRLHAALTKKLAAPMDDSSNDYSERQKEEYPSESKA